MSDDARAKTPTPGPSGVVPDERETERAESQGDDVPDGRHNLADRSGVTRAQTPGNTGSRRDDKLAAALRANLRRRKAASRPDGSTS